VSGGRIIGVDAVDNDEEILTLDVPDEALERAANAERQAFTWVYCTNGYYWYDCNWPQWRSARQLRQLRDIYHNHLVAHEQFDY